MTLAWVLAAMALLAPDRDHAELGGAIARAVDEEAPLFRDDPSRTKTAAVLVAVAFRESSLRGDAVGDDGESFCAFQIHRSSGGGPTLAADVDACVRKGFEMLRSSFRICPVAPIAWFAEGPRGCSSERAHRISRDRIAIAQRLVREVTP